MVEGQLGILDHIKVCGVNRDYRGMISMLTAHQMKHFKKEAPESLRGHWDTTLRCWSGTSPAHKSNHRRRSFERSLHQSAQLVASIVGQIHYLNDWSQFSSLLLPLEHIKYFFKNLITLSLSVIYSLWSWLDSASQHSFRCDETPESN